MTDNPFMQWIITILLECTFLGLCVVFIGYGWSELRKGKNYLKSVFMVATGAVLTLMSVVATILLLQGAS